MRTTLIAGNWKMNKTPSEATALAKEIVAKADGAKGDVLICPTYVCLDAVSQVVKGTNVKLGAQNMSDQDSGAYTGEISADMLIDLGITHVILGHSERRAIFAETDEIVNSKVKKAVEKKLIPILCVGEVLEERESGKQNEVVKEQVIAGLSGVSEAELENVVIAYEPVWAIGTGKTASPQDADDMHANIRSVLKDIYSEDAAQKMVILYGGSANDSNIDGLMAMENVDGGLVGGASLKPDSFGRIVHHN